MRATRNSGSKVQYSQSFVSLIFLVSRNGLRRKGWTAGSLQRFYWCTVFRSNTILNYDKCFSPFIFCWTMRRIFSILEKERIAHHKWRVQNYDDATQPFYEELFLCFYLPDAKINPRWRLKRRMPTKFSEKMLFRLPTKGWNIILDLINEINLTKG